MEVPYPDVGILQRERERVTGGWREKQKVSLGMCTLAQREREAENLRGSPQGE